MCHELIVSFANQTDKKHETLYKCFCNRRYFGESWEDWKKGHYGPHWIPCQRNPADGTIWGVNGIWFDGIQGNGTCLCPGPDLEPSLFCESASREAIMEEEENFTLLFFAVLCVMFLSLLVLYLYNQIPFLERFPEWMIAVILGIIIGLYLRFFSFDTQVETILHFESHTYFLLFLPPIMFQVGFSMNADTFFKNIKVINAFAIGSTILSSLLFGTVLYYALQFTELQYRFTEWFQLGWIISAIDPVATMSIFKNLHLNDKIYMYIFGESTLNNAVAIALWAALEGLKQMARDEKDLDIFDKSIFCIEIFVVFLFGSLLIGAGWAIFISFIIAHLELDEIPWIEIAFFSLSCYFPYIFWEAVGCSGVLSIFVWGLMMRNYAFNSLSVYSQVTIEYMVDTIAFSIENFVFAYLGVWIPVLIDDINIEHFLAGVLALIIGRTLSVFIVAWFTNMFKRKKIPLSHQVALLYSGLRGAVAFYLALNMTFYKEVKLKLF